MKCVGITQGNKKVDGSAYCWLYYTEENRQGEGVITDKAFFRKHIEINVGDEFEFDFRKSNDGKFYPNGVRIVE